MIEENHEKNQVRLVGTGIWTRDLPNACLEYIVLVINENKINYVRAGKERTSITKIKKTVLEYVYESVDQSNILAQ